MGHSPTSNRVLLLHCNLSYRPLNHPHHPPLQTCLRYDRLCPRIELVCAKWCVLMAILFPLYSTRICFDEWNYFFGLIVSKMCISLLHSHWSSSTHPRVYARKRMTFINWKSIYALSLEFCYNWDLGIDQMLLLHECRLGIYEDMGWHVG